jgi:hypothetical protein
MALGDRREEIFRDDRDRWKFLVYLAEGAALRSEPILIGGEKLLKPALRLMSVYRLRIDEIKENAAVTIYTRWLESVQVKGTENQEVYVSFSPRR